ncbi:MAG: RNA polymerase sigma factor [Gammaproteobacteria bacterium]|nr:RNA polymerase sigma factor [Gammaproteobacteria bacterium]
MNKQKISLFRNFGRRRRLKQQICAEHDRLYRIAWSWCNDRYQAEDLVQETLTRALSKIDNLRDENRLAVWLTQILANLHRDQYRQQQPDSGIDTDTLPGRADPERSTNRNQLIARTHQAVASLSPDHRQVLTLIDLAEFSYADTAAILDVPVGTIMSRLSRARQRLRITLEQQGIGQADVIALRRPQ